uniref:Replication factor A C-terminal domain-containing protein n=1 Tax=Lactuca sativa TaxID=4236 RepID=A0A9R1W9E6_LACSA|nr:hypothetical protein LSAT_V11C300128310 [Lactuca sativa]
MAAVNNGFSAITLNWKSILKNMRIFQVYTPEGHYILNSSTQDVTIPQNYPPPLPVIVMQFVKLNIWDVTNLFLRELVKPKVMKFLLVGSIVNIRQKLPWYYDTCSKCGKRINIVPKPNHSCTAPDKISESVVIQCKDARCNNSDFRPVTMYITPINIQDDNGTIRLSLFDREAKKLFNISRRQKLFPNQINVLKNHKFVFLVDITSYNVNNYNNIYTNVKLTEDVIQSVSLNQVPLESDDVVHNVQKV